MCKTSAQAKFIARRGEKIMDSKAGPDTVLADSSTDYFGSKLLVSSQSTHCACGFPKQIKFEMFSIFEI